MNKKYLNTLAAAHLVTDIFQGALPAMLPFLISERNISYASAALLIFAANATSLIIQPIFGVYSDKISAPWSLPIGILLAGVGLALTGIMPSFGAMFALTAISGIGIALYHPEGARLTNKYSGKNKTSAVSIFAAGGNIGFALGPILTTACIMAFNLKGTLFLIIPAIIMSILLFFNNKNIMASSNQIENNSSLKVTSEEKEKKDEWKPFARLTATLLCRSTIFFGFNTFLTLYFMHVLNQSELKGSIALSTLIIVGAVGTLFAGKLADKIGNKKIIIGGYALLFPLLFLFLNVHNPILAYIVLIPMGMALYAPYSPMVALGQKYLPNHVGLASGITLGLGVTMGGVISPILGLISDKYGIHAALSSLILIPLLAIVLAVKLPVPKADIVKEEETAVESQVS